MVGQGSLQSVEEVLGGKVERTGHAQLRKAEGGHDSTPEKPKGLTHRRKQRLFFNSPQRAGLKLTDIL